MAELSAPLIYRSLTGRVDYVELPEGVVWVRAHVNKKAAPLEFTAWTSLEGTREELRQQALAMIRSDRETRAWQALLDCLDRKYPSFFSSEPRWLKLEIGAVEMLRESERLKAEYMAELPVVEAQSA